MEMFRSFESPDWRSRYVNGVHLLCAYDPQAKCAPAYAWMMLEVLNPGEWQMVYDARLRRVSFCTARHKQRKWVDFGQVRFGAGEPTLALDVQTEAVGDVLARFAALTAERHRAMLDRSVPWGYDGPKADPEAFARDANRVKIIEALHRYGMLNP